MLIIKPSPAARMTQAILGQNELLKLPLQARAKKKTACSCRQHRQQQCSSCNKLAAQLPIRPPLHVKPSSSVRDSAQNTGHQSRWWLPGSSGKLPGSGSSEAPSLRSVPVQPQRRDARLWHALCEKHHAEPVPCPDWPRSHEKAAWHKVALLCQNLQEARVRSRS